MSLGRVLDVLAPLFLAGYVFALWSDWFTRAELNSPAKRPLYSERLTLDKAGLMEWYIAPEKLELATGTAHLSLSLNLNTLHEIPRGREQVELRLRVRAEGRLPGQEWQDRLVRDDYFCTDEPFSPAGRFLAESYGGGHLEYTLAGARIIPGEELRLSLEVLVPEGRLDRGLPRLKLVGGARLDAVYPPIGRAILRQGGIWVALAAVAWLTVRVWVVRHRGPEMAPTQSPPQSP